MMRDKLRVTALAALKQFPQSKKKRADSRLLDRLLSCPAYRQARVIGTYLALRHEYETSGLITQAIAAGKQVVVPKVIGPGQMIFVPYQSEDLVPNALGILEPRAASVVPKASIDMLHVPGLLFNTDGYRIGYGGGFYDRYLSDYQGATVATLYAFQQAVFSPAPHDIAVKELIIDEPT